MATHKYENFTTEAKRQNAMANNWRMEQARMAKLNALSKMSDEALIGYGLGKLFLANDSPIVPGGLAGILSRAFHTDDEPKSTTIQGTKSNGANAPKERPVGIKDGGAVNGGPLSPVTKGEYTPDVQPAVIPQEMMGPPYTMYANSAPINLSELSKSLNQYNAGGRV